MGRDFWPARVTPQVAGSSATQVAGDAKFPPKGPVANAKRVKRGYVQVLESVFGLCQFPLISGGPQRAEGPCRQLEH
eukprot:4476151-Lingulodinium_polyedra.AAC.1